MLNCIGIDVSKSTLNVHISKNSQDLQITNSLAAVKKLYTKLKKVYKKELETLVFVFEPTGSYSELLRKFCADKNINCFIINPKQFSNYAKALGIEVKNDEVDAKVLAQSIVLAKPSQIKVPVYDKDVEQIKELMSFYKFTCKQTSQLRGHLEALESKAGDSFSIKELKKSIKASKERENRIIEQVHQIIENNPTYKKAYENITSIIGIGQIGGIALLHLFLKYPEANQRQITSLTGLNPVYRQSGSSLQSLYKISKSGSIFYRGALFMGVMTAIRYNENFKAFYARLKAKGKHTTQAQIAVMRKMIIVAHSLYKNDTKYVKK
ncbi:MAG: IS110 family transposase [uncultured Sulfurovum sp.]|uniref:IS110 family transposase n=1 Tax=uncultured Sulfurovum sp. TaxID=269237 RepID=A0A6S6TFC1_9BACT|nr:MAG: IS110 family transposase [uncultured Sulfurovum sp.]